MKKFSIIFLLAALQVSCTQKLVLPEEPDVPTGSHTIVKAQVDAYKGTSYVWEPSTSMGIYDGAGRENVKYTLLSDYDGKSGVVELYGFGVDGELFACMPYDANGYSAMKNHRQPVKSEQIWCNGAEEHWYKNIVMVAQGDEDGNFKFDPNAGNFGLIHFTIKMDVAGEVREIMVNSPYTPLAGDVAIDLKDLPLVTNGINSISLSGIKQSCSVSQPIEFWILVPAASYQNLSVSVHGTDWVSAPVKDEVKVELGKTADVVVEYVDNNTENQDFNIIDGEYL